MCRVRLSHGHQRLMTRLSELKIHPCLLSWICSYLSNRRQHVVVNGESSFSLDVLSGVPRGSVLGPLLFLIYIDTIFSIELSVGSKLFVYEDDIVLYNPVANESCYHDLYIQQDINKISLWSRNNLMVFNISKCKCMLLSHKRNTALL